MNVPLCRICGDPATCTITGEFCCADELCAHDIWQTVLDDLDRIHQDDEEPPACGCCGGSGGGPEHWVCPSCGGSGEASRPLQEPHRCEDD